MPVFFYKAYDRAGKLSSGQINGSSRLEVVEILKNKSLFPLEVKEESKSQDVGFFSFFTSVDQKTVLAFTRQLSVLLKSGIALLQAINLILEQEQSSFRKVLFQVRDSLKEGKTFADSLASHRKVFNEIYIQIVRAGEASGNLDKVLHELADDIERSIKLQKEISGALLGPFLMILAVFGVFIGVVSFVMPQIANIIKDMGGELPWITSFLLSTSEFLTNNWIATLIGSAVTGLLLYKIFTSTFVSELLDKIFIAVPVLSTFYKTKAVVQFSETLGMLLSAGVNLPQALEIVCQVIESTSLKRTLSDAKENIIKEGKIAKYLEKTNIFPPVAFYMIKIGEESGELPQMLLRVAGDYQSELIEKTQILVGAINPIMYIIIAVLIGTLAFSIFSPISQLGNLTGSV